MIIDLTEEEIQEIINSFLLVDPLDCSPLHYLVFEKFVEILDGLNQDERKDR